ncbi:MAG: bifunctional pyr operon transcriptional regulator/uracil phosphoribosyltransferase PyrR [Ignavibacteriales bacterium]|nr:bifunctional pyr operon transcriptional regulator/uracil phosphoribosyltransferase PyrR [Ignavibacteriales bacterium]
MSTTQQLVDEKGFSRTVNRLSHEIVERNRGAESIGIVGIRTRGEFLARRIAAAIGAMENCTIPIGSLDITLYRDDLRGKLAQPQLKTTDILYDIQDKNIILVDDVLYTGRTVRSALNALMDLGRPASIQLAVLVDRGHRELPIKADFVGKNVPTAADDEVSVLMAEADGRDGVVIISHEA